MLFKVCPQRRDGKACARGGAWRHGHDAVCALQHSHTPAQKTATGKTSLYSTGADAKAAVMARRETSKPDAIGGRADLMYSRKGSERDETEHANTLPAKACRTGAAGSG
jgi:hypothetical protein